MWHHTTTVWYLKGAVSDFWKREWIGPSTTTHLLTGVSKKENWRKTVEMVMAERHYNREKLDTSKDSWAFMLQKMQSEGDRDFTEFRVFLEQACLPWNQQHSQANWKKETYTKSISKLADYSTIFCLVTKNTMEIVWNFVNDRHSSSAVLSAVFCRCRFCVGLLIPLSLSLSL